MKTLLLPKNQLFRYSFVLFLFCTIGLSSSFAQNEISIKALNSKVRSTRPQGTFFVLELTNNTSVQQNMVLSIDNNISGIENPDNSDNSQNVEINFIILDFDSRTEISTIDVNANSTYKFLVKASSTLSTPLDRWNISRLNAISKTQVSIKSSFILKVNIPDNSEE